MKRLAAAVAVSIVALVAVAQVRETVNVNVIEVPVTVIDASGNPIRGLTAANFEVVDNGQKRAITSFDMIDFASMEALKATSPLNPSARRNFMLLFDLTNAGPNAMARSQDAARRFIAESVLPRDLVGVATIDSQKGFRLLTAFTTDRQLALAAITDPTSFRGTDPLQIASASSNLSLVTERDAGAALGAGGANDNAALAREDLLQRQERMKQQNQQYMRALAEKQVEALGGLAKTLRAVPGRKQIIFLSEGFDAKVIQGRDARSSEEQQREQAAILSGQVFNVDNDQRFGSSSSMTMVDRMAQTFRGSDVVLHAMDIQGVRMQNDVAEGARANSNEGLFLVANPTGGEVFKNANDIKMNFNRLLHQQEVVYVLSFSAPTQKAGALHNLKVRLVNVPGGRASHRTGYYEAGGETAVERTLTNAEIIVNDIAQSDVRMVALAAAFPDKSGKAQVPVILEADGNDLVKDFRGSTMPVEIFIYAFDSDGVVRDRVYQKLSLDLKKVGDRLRSAGLKYYGTLSLPPGTYAVKSLVRTGETERRAYTRTDLVVPTPNEVAISTPVPIDEAPKALMVKAPSSNESYPFQLNGQQFIPSSAGHKSGGSQRFAVFIYGATADEITFETTPKTKFLGHAKGTDGTVLVLQLDPADATTANLDVTVRKKGVAEAQKTSVPVVQ
jgi:VWFA-related protein